MFIRATRIIDWDLHLLAFRSMIPWYFACDKVNYSHKHVFNFFKVCKLSRYSTKIKACPSSGKIHEFWEEQRVADDVFMQPLEFLSVLEAQ